MTDPNWQPHQHHAWHALKFVNFPDEAIANYLTLADYLASRLARHLDHSAASPAFDLVTMLQTALALGDAVRADAPAEVIAELRQQLYPLETRLLDTLYAFCADQRPTSDERPDLAPLWGLMVDAIPHRIVHRPDYPPLIFIGERPS